MAPRCTINGCQGIRVSFGESGVPAQYAQLLAAGVQIEARKDRPSLGDLSGVAYDKCHSFKESSCRPEGVRRSARAWSGGEYGGLHDLRSSTETRSREAT